MSHWKDTLVSLNVPVRRVIQNIDRSSMQIALVVDAAGRLLGTVTDGDVRRGILKGVSLDSPVKRIMRKDPVVVHADETRERVLALMAQKKVHQIPVVNGDNQVIGIEIMDELFDTGLKDNRVVIMAGGLGRRLHPLTNHVPKPLIPVGPKPVLETILENFMKCGFRHFFIAVHYKDGMIRDYFGNGSRWSCHIEYLTEERKLGTAGALGFLAGQIKKPLLVMNGDLLTKVNFLQLLNFHRENKVDATMCIREYDFQVPYGVVRMKGHRILGIDEKPVQRSFVNAGIYVLEPDVLKLVPQKQVLDMPELFQKLAKRGKKTGAFPIREYWLDIGHVNDLERAQEEYPRVFQG